MSGKQVEEGKLYTCFGMSCNSLQKAHMHKSNNMQIAPKSICLIHPMFISLQECISILPLTLSVLKVANSPDETKIFSISVSPHTILNFEQAAELYISKFHLL